jgi:MFS-type transporter involved in bile tolerance (Atg22 family)
MFAMGNLFGFFLGMILSLIVQGETKGQTAGGLAFCFGVFLIGLLFVNFLKEKLNRSDYESSESGRKTIL